MTSQRLYNLFTSNRFTANQGLIATALLFIAMISSSPAQASLQVTASVTQNPVIQGNSFMLEIVANGSIDAADWDNASLLANFMVGRTSTQSQTAYVNGNLSRSTTLATLLVAKQAGEFTIPAFTIDGATTAPITLTVLAQDDQRSQTMPTANRTNIELKVSVSPEQVYVGQQFIYTSKLLIGANTEMQAGNLTNPEVVNGTVNLVGKDINGSEIVNGSRLQTITRQYAITINTAGNVAIAPSRFEGQVSNNRLGGFGFSPATPVIIQGKQLNINVLAPVKDYQGEWLVSDFVQLSQELQPQQQDYPQGEPITRTLTLTVANVDKSALPTLSFDWPETVKVYPDKPQHNSYAQQGSYFAQQVLSFAIIPNQLGKLTLPEIKVPWFNSKTQTQEWAVLPAQTLNIIANADSPVAAPPSAAVSNTQKPTSTEAQSLASAPESQHTDSAASSLWPWLTALFATLWLLTCAAWYAYARNNRRVVQPSQQDLSAAIGQQDDIWPQLNSALTDNNASLAAHLMPQWCRQQWPDAHGKTTAFQPLSADAQQAYNELLNYVYGKQKTSPDWQGQALLDALTMLRKTTTQPKSAPALFDSPLNP